MCESVANDKNCLQLATVHFDHERQFDVDVTEEFLEHCHEDALSIEVNSSPHRHEQQSNYRFGVIEHCSTRISTLAWTRSKGTKPCMKGKQEASREA